MAKIIRQAAVACAVAGVLALGMATSSRSQARYGPYYGGPRAPAGSYGGYAYVPGYRHYWVPQYDTSGMQIDPGALGWQGWPPTGAPANPCTIGQAQQNRC
jgi:hypothetical protein